MVNTPEGHVYGECCVGEGKVEQTSDVAGFVQWLSGKWNPVVLTNIKPTPVGTAYPLNAVVDDVIIRQAIGVPQLPKEFLHRFTMIRDEQVTLQLLSLRTIPEESEQSVAWRW